MNDERTDKLRLMLFKEIMAVYSDNYTRPVNTKYFYSVTDC
jgi:hypothetical protein